jgi:hypothetical protein
MGVVSRSNVEVMLQRAVELMQPSQPAIAAGSDGSLPGSSGGVQQQPPRKLLAYGIADPKHMAFPCQIRLNPSRIKARAVASVLSLQAACPAGSASCQDPASWNPWM